MNARKLTMIGVLLLATWHVAGAAGVTWIDGATPPAAWTIQPASPRTADVITFSGPTAVYSNSCEGTQDLGGSPQLLVDSASKIVLLWFQGPPPAVCTRDYRPVAGLQGDFGPLAAGDWIFTCLSKALPFEIRFTVGDKRGYHVDKDAPGPAHDGATWATAYLTLQDALATAGSGDEIVVAEGTYRPDQGAGVSRGDRTATFELRQGMVVRGGYAGYGQPDPDARDVARHQTVLSGDLSSDDLWGILNRDDNSYHVVTGPVGGSGTTLDGFSVVSGQADGPFPHHLGGGLYCSGGELRVLSCTFQGNTAGFGGGILNFGSSLTMVNTQVIGNRAFVSGGGLYNYEGGTVLHNCRVVGNSADQAAVMGGAAIDNLTGTLAIRNSTIADNLSPNGMAITSFSWDWDAVSTIDIANSILYNGGSEISSNDPATVSVAYSDVQGGWTGAGNLNVNPQFVAPGARSIEGEWIDGDYRLKSASSCINAGDDASVPSDVLDADGDGNVAEKLPFDLDAAARIQGSRVDMGAYEQASSTPPPGPLQLTACVSPTRCFVLAPDPMLPNTYIGSIELNMDTDLKLELHADVTATSAAGGTWTGWLVPNTVSPPGGKITLWAKGEGLNVGALPTSGTVQVAAVEIWGSIIP